MDVMYNALQNAKNACHCIANTCDVDMSDAFFFQVQLKSIFGWSTLQKHPYNIHIQLQNNLNWLVHMKSVLQVSTGPDIGFPWLLHQPKCWFLRYTWLTPSTHLPWTLLERRSCWRIWITSLVKIIAWLCLGDVLCYQLMLTSLAGIQCTIQITAN